MSDLRLDDEDNVLLESIVLSAADDVVRAPASDRDRYAPTRRRAYVETSGDHRVFLGTGETWINVEESGGLISNLLGGGSVEAEQGTIKQQSERHHWVEDDAHLDEIMPDLSTGSVLHLLAGEYNTDRTFSERVEIRGIVASDWGSSGTTRINAKWTFDETSTVIRVGGQGGLNAGLVFNADNSKMFQSIFNSDVFVNGDGFVGVGNSRINFTFDTGTSGGLIDGNGGKTTVNDNGTNNVGDIV